MLRNFINYKKNQIGKSLVNLKKLFSKKLSSRLG